MSDSKSTEELRRLVSWELVDAAKKQINAAYIGTTLPVDLAENIDNVMRLLDQELERRVKAAENAVIDKANSQCECGEKHFGTPVRSVMGNVTTYCQFSRVRPSTLTNQDTKEDK